MWLNYVWIMIIQCCFIWNEWKMKRKRAECFHFIWSLRLVLTWPNVVWNVHFVLKKPDSDALLLKYIFIVCQLTGRTVPPAAGHRPVEAVDADDLDGLAVEFPSHFPSLLSAAEAQGAVSRGHLARVVQHGESGGRRRLGRSRATVHLNWGYTQSVL